MRRIDEKTVGIDTFVHSELKRICQSKKIDIKNAVMTALTDYIIKKNKND